MTGEFERDAAGIADARPHALGELQVMSVARREIGAGLRDADDRAVTHDFFGREAVIEVALEI
jgi:hypothetical protein